MTSAAGQFGLHLPERELACAPLDSSIGRSYLAAMRSGINCALANRQILTHLVREVFAEVAPKASIRLLYDVSHNTCQEEEHLVGGKRMRLFVHRKGATRAWGPGRPDCRLNIRCRAAGADGDDGHVLVHSGDAEQSERLAFGSACRRPDGR